MVERVSVKLTIGITYNVKMIETMIACSAHKHNTGTSGALMTQRCMQAEEDGGEAVQDSFLDVDRHAAAYVSRRRASQTLALHSRPQRLRYVTSRHRLL